MPPFSSASVKERTRNNFLQNVWGYALFLLFLLCIVKRWGFEIRFALPLGKGSWRGFWIETQIPLTPFAKGE